MATFNYIKALLLHMHLPNSDLEKSSEMELLLPPPTTYFISEHTKTMPNDIIFNILMKLPVKPLLKFRLVCKNWDSIIRSQTFKLNYSISRPQGYLFVHFLQYSPIPSQPCTIFWENSFTKISKLEIPTTFGDPSLNSVGRIVVGSCKGLLCITNFKQFGRELYIWNPSIRKHKILTTTSLFTGRFRQRFKHPKTSITVALGFDSKINDYKILRIASFNWKSRHCKKNNPPPQAEIYLLGTDSWRNIGLPEDLTMKFVQIYSWGYGYINGGFHWLARFVNEQGKYYLSILRFEVEEERFTEVKLPNDYLNGIDLITQRLVVFKGFLGLIVNGDNDDGEKICYIWIMNNESSSWTRQKLRFEEIKWHCGCVGDKLVLAEGYRRVSLFDPLTLEEKTVDVPRPASVHAFTQSLALL